MNTFSRNTPDPSRRDALAPFSDAASLSLPWPPGRMSLLTAGEGAPLLLVHSLNAAASGYEVKPIFDHARSYKQVFALDLPGFGRSARGRAPYSIAFYVSALLRAADEVRSRSGSPAIDALGLSLSCEFLARAALERPDLFRSLVFVTPTGFETGSEKRRAEPGQALGSPALERALNLPLWRRALYKGLVSRASLRFFLRRTFGGSDVPAGLIDYAYRSAHQPEAEFAPFAFASGKLFAADIRDVYEQLELPVWLAHGTRGSFSDFAGAEWVRTRPNWAVTPFETGAFPQFQARDQFMPLLVQFLEEAASERQDWPDALALAPVTDPGRCL